MRINESKLRKIIRGVIRESNFHEETGLAPDGSELAPGLATVHGDRDMMGREVRPQMPSEEDVCCSEFIEKVISRLEEKHWLVKFNGSPEDVCHDLLSLRNRITLEQRYGRGSRPISVDINYQIKFWFNDYWLSLRDESYRNHNKSKYSNHVSRCVDDCIKSWHDKNQARR